MSQLDEEVERAVEAICALGCRQVTAHIDSLRRGESRPGYRALDESQRSALLGELQSIMAVYDGK